MEYKCVIWDWNGTLINDTDLCVHLTSLNLVDHGLSAISKERYQEAYQHPIIKMHEELGLKYADHTAFAERSRVWLERYEAARVDCELHTGAREILSTLKTRGVNQLVLSAHRHDLVMAALEHYGIREHFSSATGLTQGGGHGKIEVGLEIIKDLPYSRTEVIMVGDSCHDHEVAEALQVECHLIANGADSAKKLKATGRAVFDDLAGWGKHQGLI